MRWMLPIFCSNWPGVALLSRPRRGFSLPWAIGLFGRLVWSLMSAHFVILCVKLIASVGVVLRVRLMLAVLRWSWMCLVIVSVSIVHAWA